MNNTFSEEETQSTVATSESEPRETDQDRDVTNNASFEEEDDETDESSENDASDEETSDEETDEAEESEQA